MTGDGKPTPGPSLTFSDLREANKRRLPQFKNRRGQPAHSQPDGSDWCLAQWCNAVTGELGEAANLIKKIERGDVTLDETRADLAKEFADVVTYLDILAFRADVDLGQATVEKFNEVSVRVGADVRLALSAPDLAAEVERWQQETDAVRAISAQRAETIKRLETEDWRLTAEVERLKAALDICRKHFGFLSAVASAEKARTTGGKDWRPSRLIIQEECYAAVEACNRILGDDTARARKDTTP